MGGMKVRPDLGHSGSWPDAGPHVDPECLLTIMDPEHTLNRKYHLLDPGRYNLASPVVQRLLATTQAGGCPAPIIVRLNGELPKKHRVTEYLRSAYPKGRKDSYLGGEQPAIEVIEGATRTWLLCLVNEERRGKGLTPYRARLDLRKNVTDEEMREMFLRAQTDRQGNSFLQDLALYRSYQAVGDLSVEQLAEQMRQPPDRIKVYMLFDGLEDAVAQAYAEGLVTLARVKQIAKLPRAEQGAALSAPQQERAQRVVRFSAKETLKLADRLQKAADPIHRFTPAEVVALLRVIGGDQDAREQLGDLAGVLDGGGA